jgi:hypothetical protein
MVNLEEILDYLRAFPNRTPSGSWDSEHQLKMCLWLTFDFGQMVLYFGLSAEETLLVLSQTHLEVNLSYLSVPHGCH